MENINVSKDEGSPYKDQDNYDFVKPKNRSSNDLFKESPMMQHGKMTKDNLTVSRKHDSSSKSKNKKLNELDKTDFSISKESSTNLSSISEQLKKRKEVDKRVKHKTSIISNYLIRN